jgi:hypothetical protein
MTRNLRTVACTMPVIGIYSSIQLRREGIRIAQSTFIGRPLRCSSPIGERPKIYFTPRRMSNTAARRVGIISKHLQLDITNSAETLPSPEPISKRGRKFSSSSNNQSTMSTQPEHPALLIPGPIEFDDAVLQSMSHFR